jgi:hypothetical protein
MNEQMKHLVAALYQYSAVVPQAAVPSEGLGPQSRSALMGPLAYGTCQTLEMARCAADEALREGLRGQFPASCVVLDMHVARLEAAIRDVLQWEAKRMGAVSAAALRDVLRALANT